MQNTKKIFTVWSDFLDDTVSRGDLPLPECALLGGNGFSGDADAVKRMKKAILELIIKYDVRCFRVVYRNELGLVAADFLSRLKEFYATLSIHLVALEKDRESAESLADRYDMIEIIPSAPEGIYGVSGQIIEYLIMHDGYMIHYEGLITFKLRQLLETWPGKSRFTLIQIGDAAIIPEE